MADVTYTGAGKVTDADYKYVKWVGSTKGGKAVQIVLSSAICLSNPDWTFAEKNDTVISVEFEGVYNDTTLATGDRTEPWTLTLEDGVTAGSSEIVLGAGKLYLGTSASDAVAIALSRGGGKFTVEREYRKINADGDPGGVKGRIVQEGGVPKLSINALTWLTKVSSIYSGISVVTPPSPGT